MKGLPYSIQNTSHMSDFFFLFKQPKDVFKGDLCSKKMELWKFGDNHKGKASQDCCLSISFSKEKN